ncbi:MAG: hypothetical protein ABSE49_10225 [Polyangiaceae bacterium]|jgi:hypothetical protein
MNTTSLRFGTRTIVIFSLLALPAGSLACGAAPGSPEDGVDPSASPTSPGKPALAAADVDAAAPVADTTEELDDPSSGAAPAPTARREPLQKF